jgi:hypothetical protein
VGEGFGHVLQIGFRAYDMGEGLNHMLLVGYMQLM